MNIITFMVYLLCLRITRIIMNDHQLIINIYETFVGIHGYSCYAVGIDNNIRARESKSLFIFLPLLCNTDSPENVKNAAFSPTKSRIIYFYYRLSFFFIIFAR